MFVKYSYVQTKIKKNLRMNNVKQLTEYKIKYKFS